MCGSVVDGHWLEWQGTQTAVRGVWPTSISVFISVYLSASVLPPLIPSCSTGGVNTEQFPQDWCVLMQTANSAFSRDAAEQCPSLPVERTPLRHNCFRAEQWFLFSPLKRITTASVTTNVGRIINNVCWNLSVNRAIGSGFSVQLARESILCNCVFFPNRNNKSTSCNQSIKNRLIVCQFNDEAKNHLFEKGWL